MILVTKEVRAAAARARNTEYTRAKSAGEPRDEDREFRAGLEAAFDHVTSTHTTAHDEDVDEKLREVLTVGGYRTDGDFATLIERVHFMALSNRDLALMQETLIKRYEETKSNLSQPQPVAQGDVEVTIVPQKPLPSSIDSPNLNDPNIARAVRLAMTERESGESFGAGEFQFSNYAQREAVAWMAPGGNIVTDTEKAAMISRSFAAMYSTPLYATPTIPTGHRVVPVELDICAVCDGRFCTACDPTSYLMPIEMAPKDGTHILLVKLDPSSTGFGWPNGVHQPTCEVCHWFDDGFYSSNFGVEQEKPWADFTHWTRVPSFAAAPDAGGA